MKTITTLKKKMKKKTHNTIVGTMHGTYDVWVRCDNCKDINNVAIIKGKQISETCCPNCGCKTLIKK